jgi:hypothetical protein
MHAAMRRVHPFALLAVLAGCDPQGTSARPSGEDAGDDATTNDEGGDEESGDAFPIDAGAPAQPLCTDYGAEGGNASSDDCIRIGRCPQDCLSGTASAYACAAADPAIGAYPSVFRQPGDPVTIIGYEPSAYPWDAGAFVGCAAEACVRWSLADHVEGGSQWPSDPCSEGDGSPATQAWLCPPYQGFAPPQAGCFNGGPGQQIGGTAWGIDPNVVWCCPPMSDGAVTEGGAAADTGPPLDSSAVDGGVSAESGPEASPD